MTRTVDKIFRGSFTGSAGANGNFAMSVANADLLVDFYEEFSVAAYVQIKPQPEAHWNAYPGVGVSKLTIGAGGFNMQISGGSGISKGAVHFRVDDDVNQYAMNPTAQSGVMAGCMLGWQFHVGTVKRGTSRYYINGQKAGQRTFPFVVGHRAPATLLSMQGYGGAGGSSRLHRNSSVYWAVYNRELTPEEVSQWYFADMKPNRSLVIEASADNWLSGTAPVNTANPLISFTTPVGTLKNTEVPL